MEKNAFDPRLFLSHVLYGYGAYLYAGASPDDYNYNVLLITLFWLICVYTVHITTLQILFLITQSFALKEEYRTMKIVSDALTSQTANLQINLEQLLKARHDFRHHLAILKGCWDRRSTRLHPIIWKATWAARKAAIHIPTAPTLRSMHC